MWRDGAGEGSDNLQGGYLLSWRGIKTTDRVITIGAVGITEQMIEQNTQGITSFSVGEAIGLMNAVDHA
jgi:hypothetical protein